MGSGQGQDLLPVTFHPNEHDNGYDDSLSLAAFFWMVSLVSIIYLVIKYCM
jgi:hypothetical protein